MVPSTTGSKYSETTVLSGNWAGFTMVISLLPFCEEKQWCEHLSKEVKGLAALKATFKAENNDNDNLKI